MQRGLRVITLQGALEKSPIFLSQYWKNEGLDGTIIIWDVFILKFLVGCPKSQMIVYHFEKAVKLEWTEAERSCNTNYGGHLASINSEKEYEQIK